MHRKMLRKSKLGSKKTNIIIPVIQLNEKFDDRGEKCDQKQTKAFEDNMNNDSVATDWLN